MALASYALYTVLLRKDADRPDAPDALVLATATAVWGTAIMLPWLAWRPSRGPCGSRSIARDHQHPGARARRDGTGPLLFNYGAERLPAAVSGVATAAIPALGYGFALLLGEPFDPIKGIGGAIALTGVVIAALPAPDVEPSPPGSALPEPADLATGPLAASRQRAVGDRS